MSKKIKKRPLFKLCVLLFVCYMAGVLINLQISLTEKQEELNEINEKIAIAAAQSNQLELILSIGNDEDYIERIAKEELRFAYPDEKVYIDISGN